MWVQFDGWCAARGVDPSDLTIDRFCNLVYYWATRNMDEEKVTDFEARMTAGVGAPEGRLSRVWSRDEELAQFKQAGG